MEFLAPSVVDPTADDGFVPAPKSPMDFLKNVSSDVQEAIRKVTNLKSYSRPRRREQALPTTFLVGNNSASVLAIGADELPPIKTKAASGHAKILNSVLGALQKEADYLKKHEEENPSSPASSLQQKPVSGALHKFLRQVGKRTSPRRSKTRIHYALNDRSTPDMVRKLAARHRIEHDYHERMDGSPEPKRGLSVASTIDKKLAKYSLMLSKNPHVLDSSKSLAEMRNIMKFERRSHRMTLPSVDHNMITTKKIHWGDTELNFPVLNFQQRAASQRFKSAHNDPEYLAGVDMPCELIDTSLLNSRETNTKTMDAMRKQRLEQLEKKLNLIFNARVDKHIPLEDSRQLAAIRRNRMMQLDKKWDIIPRIRDMKRSEVKLARQKRKIDKLKVRLREIDVEHEQMSQYNDVHAKDLELKLRDSDQKTILSIQTANAVNLERKEAAKETEKIEGFNRILDCQNVRYEEQIRLLDRFIRVLYDILPPDLVPEALMRQEQPFDWSNEQPDEQLPNDRNKGFFEKAEEEEHIIPVEEVDELCFVDDCFVPPIPIGSVVELRPLLNDLVCNSNLVCIKMGKLRHERKMLMEKVGSQGVEATRKNKRILSTCEKYEDEIRELEKEIAEVKADNAQYENGIYRRDHLRRPINILRNYIFRSYRRNFDKPEEEFPKMLQKMTDCVREIISRFDKVPLKFVQKCFGLADRDAAISQKVISEMVRKEAQDKRITRYFYRSLDPPTVVWGRPLSSSRDAFYELDAHENREESQEALIAIPSFYSDIQMESVEITDSYMRTVTETNMDGVHYNAQRLQLRRRPLSEEPYSPDELLDMYCISSTAQHDLEYEAEMEDIEITRRENDFGEVVRVETREQMLDPPKPAPSYPALTASNIREDERIRHFFENYEQLMDIPPPPEPAPVVEEPPKSDETTAPAEAIAEPK